MSGGRVYPAAAVIVAVLFATGCGSQPGPERQEPKLGALAGDCSSLVGARGLLGRAMALTYKNGVITTNPDGNTDTVRLEIQESLFRIATREEKLADPIGQLVDFLDDPPTYLKNKDLMAMVRRADSDIRKICAR